MPDAPKKLHNIDGWYTDDPKEFRFYTRDAKTWSYWAQVRNDARSWKVWLLWLYGVAWPAAGLVKGSVPLVLMGALMMAFVLHVYVHMLRRVVRGYRNAVLLDGIVASFDTRHPLFRSMVAGELKQAVVAKQRVMALLPESAVKAYARIDGSMEVLVSHSPQADFSRVVAFKQP